MKDEETYKHRAFGGSFSRGRRLKEIKFLSFNVVLFIV
jgi:hypothetical protein